MLNYRVQLFTKYFVVSIFLTITTIIISCIKLVWFQAIQLIWSRCSPMHSIFRKQTWQRGQMRMWLTFIDDFFCQYCFISSTTSFAVLLVFLHRFWLPFFLSAQFNTDSLSMDVLCQFINVVLFLSHILPIMLHDYQAQILIH